MEPIDPNANTGKALRALRDYHDVPKGVLARELGVSRSTLWHTLKGEHVDPEFAKRFRETVERIAKSRQAA